MNVIQKTLALTTIILITASLNTAQAGFSSCTSSNHRTVDEKVLSHPSGDSKAKLKLVKAHYSCDLFEGEHLRVEISFKKLSDAPLPNHGFLSATITSYAPWGHQIHQKHFERSAFAAGAYPFNAQASDIHVELEEFGRVDFVH